MCIFSVVCVCVLLKTRSHCRCCFSNLPLCITKVFSWLQIFCSIIVLVIENEFSFVYFCFHFEIGCSGLVHWDDPDLGLQFHLFASLHSLHHFHFCFHHYITWCFLAVPATSLLLLCLLLDIWVWKRYCTIVGYAVL